MDNNEMFEYQSIPNEASEPEIGDAMPAETADSAVIGFIDGDNNEDIIKQIKQDKKRDKKEKKKKNKIIKSVIWILVIVIVSVTIAGSVVIGTSELLGIGPGRGVEVVVEIEKGMSTQSIANALKQAGAINSSLAFRVYSRVKGLDGKYSYGVYTFNNELGYADLAELLMTAGQKAETKTVTIPEGIGINDYVKNVNGEKVTVLGIASLLEKAGVCTKSDFIEAVRELSAPKELSAGQDSKKVYYELEGYLFPDTYSFYSYDSKECAALAAKKMLKEGEKRITADMIARAAEMGRSMNEIYTMASIIQMESGNNFEAMPEVAAVFYNRLKSSNFATLGSSPTCYYGDSFRNDDGRYNTYTAKGLPPGPLCSPGIEAIKAALYPAEDTPYYYFVTDKNGKFYFHKTLEEQNKTIATLKQGNQWIYEYFNK